MNRVQRELVVDSFAGGGGTSEGIRQALGRDPDIAINHDPMALAMHRVNHPGTRHMVEDVWQVDARSMCHGEPIGLLWMSPDCKHFSKAKGGKPREKAIRGLAWVGVRWVKSLPKRQRPRVIVLENVEEFQKWGPLLANGKPCRLQEGATFRAFIGAFEAMGYVAEWRELRACDYGDPTIRKRLIVVLRRDGEEIVWPERTHGNPKDPRDAERIAAGDLKPWRTAAEIIDFSLPCPSIFETSAEIKSKLGIRAIRPLRDNTLARVAKGTVRYVINAAQPFIVPITHQGDNRVNALDEPLRTITTAKRGEHALVTPFVTKFNTGAVGHPLDQPLATVTSHASAPHGGGAAPLGLVSPLLVRTAHGERDKNGKKRGRGDLSVEEPMPTVLTSNDMAVISPLLVGCGGRAGQSEPRPADEPVLTQTAKADACVVTPFLVPRYQERPGQAPRTRSVEEPFATVVPGGNEGVLAAVHLSTMRNSGKPYSAGDEPTQTMTAGGANAAIVAAFLAQHNTGVTGHEVGEPVSTVTAKGANQNLVAAHMVNLRGTDRRDAPVDEPLRAVTAQGNHAGLVATFLAKYYGAGLPSQSVDEPLHTVTAKPRHGLVTVAIEGETFVITDIGMRMLTPRERFSAQGFRPSYIIDHGIDEAGETVRFTQEQQGYMCGNSVCPGMAFAVVSANYQPRRRRVSDKGQAFDLVPLFEGVAAE